MAQRWNPLTKTYEDDGTGLSEDPSGLGTPPPMSGPAAVAPPVAAVGGGGGITINTGMAPPEREASSSVERKVKGAGTQTADAAVADATEGVLAASDAAGETDERESLIRQYGAGELEMHAIQGGNRQADLDEERKRSVADFIEQDRQEIDKVAKAATKKNAARVDFWKGNKAGEIFAALLRGIDRAASSFRGETGPTGVDRIIDAKIDAHERMLVGEWEKSQEARAMKKTAHGDFLSELEKRKIAATNQSQAELTALNARVEKYLASLAPEKAEAARQQWQADFQLAQARLNQKSAEGYDKVVRHAETRRTGGPGQAPAIATLANGEQVAVASPEEGKALADSKAQADSIRAQANEVIKQIQGMDKGVFGTVKSVGGQRNDLNDVMEGFANALAAKKGDASPRAVTAQKDRFWPGMSETPEGLIERINAVAAEELRDHDARVKAAARAATPAATAIPGAQPGAAPAPAAAAAKPAPKKGDTTKLRSGRVVTFDGQRWQ
jgi:hypothetical protein